MIEQFVIRWRGLVGSLARRYGLPFDDVEQEARISYWNAQRRADSDRSVDPLAVTILKWRVIDLVRRASHGWVPLTDELVGTFVAERVVDALEWLIMEESMPQIENPFRQGTAQHVIWDIVTTRQLLHPEDPMSIQDICVELVGVAMKYPDFQMPADPRKYVSRTLHDGAKRLGLEVKTGIVIR